MFSVVLFWSRHSLPILNGLWDWAIRNTDISSLSRDLTQAFVVDGTHWFFFFVKPISLPPSLPSCFLPSSSSSSSIFFPPKLFPFPPTPPPPPLSPPFPPPFSSPSSSFPFSFSSSSSPSGHPSLLLPFLLFFLLLSINIITLFLSDEIGMEWFCCDQKFISWVDCQESQMKRAQLHLLKLFIYLLYCSMLKTLNCWVVHYCI